MLFEVMDKSMSHLDKYECHATCRAYKSSKSLMSHPVLGLEILAEPAMNLRTWSVSKQVVHVMVRYIFGMRISILL